MINTWVKMVMIDTSSFVDILYVDAFQKLELSTNDLTPVTYSLTGFIGDSISSLGTMNLYIIFRDDACSKIILAKFMMVYIPSVYNIVIN